MWVQFDLWPLTCKNQTIKSFRRDDQVIKHTFCQSKILISVAKTSTGEIYKWLSLDGDHPKGSDTKHTGYLRISRPLKGQQSQLTVTSSKNVWDSVMQLYYDAN